AAVQICRWRQGEVIGTASRSKHEALLRAGVAHCIDYRSQDFEVEVARITSGRGVDVVLDAVGGHSARKRLRRVAPRGRLCRIGAWSMAPGRRRSLIAAARGLRAMPTFRAVPLMNQNRAVFGVNLGHLWREVHKLRDMLAEILGLVEASTFDPVVDRTFPFERAAEAHAYIQERKNFGKVLLVP